MENTVIKNLLGALALAVITLASTAQTPSSAGAIADVDLTTYAGRWYQVAHYPNFFQRTCARNTTAEYTPQDNGTVTVLNRCEKADGSVISSEGLAKPRDASLNGTHLSPAQLQVSFLPAALRWLPVGWGNYDVVYLSDDQRTAIISEPTQKYLWVLKRDQGLSTAERGQLETQLTGMGFDLSKVQWG